ncbi:MAG: hypothetical protein H6Q10_1064, partial [Acidobacteria bacterium]|nr:hypothetical protein [Acidobacteriota bacterium]
PLHRRPAFSAETQRRRGFVIIVDCSVTPDTHSEPATEN